jgi:hypothetical protein
MTPADEYPDQPEPLDAETERLLVWFVKNSKGRLAWSLGFDELHLVPWDTDLPRSQRDPNDQRMKIVGVKHGKGKSKT